MPFCDSGEGFGRAPLTTLVQSALESLTADKDVFAASAGSVLPVRTGFVDMTWQRRAKLKAAGFLTLMAIVALGIPPHPISPLLIWLVLDGRDGLGLDFNFLYLTCKDIHARLARFAGIQLTRAVLTAEGNEELLAIFNETGRDVRTLSFLCFVTLHLSSSMIQISKLHGKATEATVEEAKSAILCVAGLLDDRLELASEYRFFAEGLLTPLGKRRITDVSCLMDLH